MSRKIIIGEYQDGIDEHYYHPADPNDWIHTLQEDRLFPTGYGVICLNSERALQTVIGAVGKIVTDKIISVSVQDNTHWCDCSLCHDKLPSETLIDFVNQIARTYPDKKFSTLAYYKTEIPPTIRPLENVEVIITTIEQPHDLPYETSPRMVEWRKRLQGWLSLTPNIVIWDYYSNFRHLLMPYPVLLNIVPNLRWFQSLGIQDFIIQTNAGIGHEFSEVKAELIAGGNLMPILYKRYGFNACYVWFYIQLLAKYQKLGKWLICYADPSEFRGSFLSDKALAEYTWLLNRKGLEEVYLQVLYAKIELNIATSKEINTFRLICEGLGDVTVNEEHKTYKEYLYERR